MTENRYVESTRLISFCSKNNHSEPLKQFGRLSPFLSIDLQFFAEKQSKR